MSSQKYNFSGKVALVTGSSSGIGAAIAIQFAQYGASVTITGRDSVELTKVGKEVKKVSGKEPLQLIGDLLEPGFTKKLVDETVAKFGQLDFLINNAGAGSPNSGLKDDNMMEEFDKTMSLNTRSVVELIYLSVPHLEKTKGNIVNISSIAALKSYSLIYSISKAALDMATKGSAKELGPKGIRVNSINPGPVKTRFGRYNKDMVIDTFANLTVLGRVAESVEIANLASFLVSDDAANITGSIIVNDGGMLIK